MAEKIKRKRGKISPVKIKKHVVEPQETEILRRSGGFTIPVDTRQDGKKVMSILSDKGIPSTLVQNKATGDFSVEISDEAVRDEISRRLSGLMSRGKFGTIAVLKKLGYL